MPVRNYFTANGRIYGEKQSGGSRTDYVRDYLGSVVATTDTNGNLVNAYRYKPYGNELARTGGGADPEYRWTGAFGNRWIELGNYLTIYVFNRHYSPSIGLWQTIDRNWPLQRAYQYCIGNPTSRYDEFGLNSCDFPRTDDCKLKINLGCGCVIVDVEAKATSLFLMVLPRTAPQSLVKGHLYIDYEYEVLVSCPGGHLYKEIIRGKFQADATSSTRSMQIFGRWWRPKHPIPKGPEWTLHTKCWFPSLAGMIDAPEGYRFMITPQEVTGTDDLGNVQTRKYFRVHPDGGHDGTWGCIAPMTVKESKRTRSCLLNLRDDGGILEMPLAVNYKPGK